MEGAWGFQGNTAKRSMNAEKRPVHSHTLPHTVNSERTHTVETRQRWCLEETININK